MNKYSIAFAGAALFLGLTTSSHALVISVTNNTSSAVAGATTIDFGNSPVNETGPVAGPLPSGTAGGVTYSYSGGALYNYDPYPASDLANGISARPPGSTGNYWSIGTSPVEQSGPGIASFSTGLSYFGFLWGSPDGYNTVSIYDGSTLLGSYDGSLILVPPDGDQSYARYVNIFSSPGEVITKVVFTSSNNAFETDNDAFIAANVPEPATGGLFLAGMGILGWARRRKQNPAA